MQWNAATLKAVEPALADSLNVFALKLAQGKFRSLKKYFDPEHLKAQMNMYLTDTFMFGSFGNPVLRDTEKIFNFYLRETFGLTQADEAIFLKNTRWKNFFSLTNRQDIQQVYFKEMKKAPYGCDVFFLAKTFSGELYFGRIMWDWELKKFTGAWG